MLQDGQGVIVAGTYTPQILCILEVDDTCFCAHTKLACPFTSIDALSHGQAVINKINLRSASPRPIVRKQ